VLGALGISRCVVSTIRSLRSLLDHLAVGVVSTIRS